MSRPPGSNSGALWLALALVVLASLAIRVRLLDVPLERDEGEYAYVAQLLLEGVPPYRQAYTMKFPGVALAYAPFVSALGHQPAAVRASLLGVNALSILLLFLLARRLFGAEAALATAASYALLALGRGPQGLYANTEHFVLLFALAGLALLLSARERHSSRGLFASGLLLGAAIVMKQHGALFAVFGGMLLLGGRAGLPGARIRNSSLAIFALGVAIPLGLLCGWMLSTGAWQHFWFWSFRYAREYLGFVSLEQAPGFASLAFAQVVDSAPLLWALAAVGMGDALLRREGRPSRAFLWGFTLTSVLALSLALRFRPHYFLFLLPAVAIWAALGARALGEGFRALVPRLRAGVTSAALLGIALLGGLYVDADYLFEMGPNEVSVANFGAHPFPETLTLGRWLREASESDDRIAVLASEPEIYFYAERASATPFLYMTEILRRFPSAPGLRRELVSRLEADPPRYLVFSSNFNPFLREEGLKRAPQLSRWIREAVASAYRRVGVVEVRRDAASRERWGPAAATPPRSEDWLMVYERIPTTPLRPR